VGRSPWVQVSLASPSPRVALTIDGGSTRTQGEELIIHGDQEGRTVHGFVGHQFLEEQLTVLDEPTGGLALGIEAGQDHFAIREEDDQCWAIQVLQWVTRP
jgi:hypothetical protein